MAVINPWLRQPGEAVELVVHKKLASVGFISGQLYESRQRYLSAVVGGKEDFKVGVARKEEKRVGVTAMTTVRPLLDFTSTVFTGSRPSPKI
eukprot:CAMPEP_0177767056 /NCGR_PEP_ID=MMETSP0491_2-20121128/8867_1 /TAXON_ID=63592 /ORGANISM="Tetraselmis chuii, Strain PLY429" /LENGTH=91 /DNA_ID=CAMNT_0019283537 /DNA_START=859 /DNA_END=1135 /DNA_ORIENTATION=-